MSDIPESNIAPDAPDANALFEAAIKAAGAPTVVEPEPEGVELKPADEQVEVQPEAEPEAPKEPEPEAPKPPAEEPVTAQLKRLMAREKAARELEAKAKAEVAELAPYKARIAELEARERSFELDPVGYIRALNPKISLAEVAKQLWLEELGENAPPEHRATREIRSTKLEIDKLRMELEAERKRQAEAVEQSRLEAAYAQYTGALEAYAKAAPDTLPMVKAYTAVDASKVVRGMLKIAETESRSGVVLTPEQCAQKLEEKLASLRKVIGTQPAVAQVATPAPARTAPTLRNQHQSVQPNRAPDESEEAMFQKAMAAALATRPQ